jgi:hypothetical protein
MLGNWEVFKDSLKPLFNELFSFFEVYERPNCLRCLDFPLSAKI